MQCPHLTVEWPTCDDVTTLWVNAELVGPWRAAVEGVDEDVVFRKSIAVLGRHVTDLRIGRLILGHVEAITTVVSVADEARFLVVDVGHGDDHQRRAGARRHAMVDGEHREPEDFVALAVYRVLCADDAALVHVERDGHAARDAVLNPTVIAVVPVGGFHLLTNVNKPSRGLTVLSLANKAFIPKNSSDEVEEVVLELIKYKCMPILLYGLEACPMKKVT